MGLIKRSRFFAVAMSVMVILGFASGLANDTSALGGTVWGGRSWKYSGDGSMYYSAGYFENRFQWSIEGKYGYYPSVLPTSNMYRSGSNAIPSWVNTVDELISFLKTSNSSSTSTLNGKWKRAGSAFVVHSMLGRNGNQANSNGGRNISNADFEELRSRLNSAQSISWSSVASTDGVNTESSATVIGSDVDVQAERATKSDVAIVITDSQGAKYKLFRKCANPVGALSGLSSLNYTLTPTITGTPESSDGNGTAEVSPVVNNSGSTASSTAVWQVVKFELEPGVGIKSGGDSNLTPGQYFPDSSPVANGSKAFPRGITSLDIISENIGDHPVGTHICYALSVKPISQNNSNWRHSDPFCIVIAKNPKVQVWGGDLVIGPGFSGKPNLTSSAITSTTKKTAGSESRIFGSWVEYGIFATGSINGTASKSAFSGDGLIAGALGDQCAFSVLSFTNVDSGSALCTNIGNYSSSQPIPDVGASFTTTRSLGNNASINLAIDDLNGVYTATGNLTISGGGPAGAIEKGKWVVINAPNANVTISGNINYTTDQMNSIDDIPQLVIIAKTIGIKDNVTNVDSWLIATDQINTCSSVAEDAKLTDKDCDKTLMVNGPVMTNKLLLRRTAGSGTGSHSGDPAEVFNLRADAYLWAIARSNDLGRLQTVYSTELPPRF